jgi:thiamine-monophosphate kinase
MGLQVLEREKQVFQVNPNSQPDLDAYTYLIERQAETGSSKRRSYFIACLRNKTNSND